jgi:hypothetical protein
LFGDPVHSSIEFLPDGVEHFPSVNKGLDHKAATGMKKRFAEKKQLEAYIKPIKVFSASSIAFSSASHLLLHQDKKAVIVVQVSLVQVLRL